MKASDNDFVDEAEELLTEAGSYLLDIQEAGSAEPDPDSINSLFRTMHTLKGMSGMYGHQCITDISHALENILDDIRLGRADMDDQSVDFFFKHMDTLRSLITSLREGHALSDEDAQACMTEITDFKGGAAETQEADPLEALEEYEDLLSILSEYEEHRLKSNLKKGKGIYKMNVVYSLDDFDTRLKELTADIKDFGEMLSTMPTSEGIPAGSIGFTLVIGSGKTPQEVKELSGVDVEVMSSMAEPEEEARPADAARAPGGPGGQQAPQPTMAEDASLKTSATTVRVNIEKLDRLLNAVGELNLIKNNTRKLWTEMSEVFGKNPLVIDLYKIVQNMERRLHELQTNVLEVRMVPIGQIFTRLGQVVRRYTRGAGKEINLTVFGEDTEIDKFLAEEIVDPLMHIVRNSIDHGIESPEDREASGKPRAGSLQLRASQRGNSVVIEITDDGKGIDVDVVRRKAIERGLMSSSSALGDMEILDFMFEAGFSTKKTVSETSGRGVGLDVVRAKMVSLGGYTEITTEVGMGTIFNLTLPITLAIVKSLMVRVGKETFAMPLSSMQETMDIIRMDIKHLDGGDVVDFRGEMIPIASLGEVLHIPDDGEEFAYAMLIGHGDKRLFLIVDKMTGQQEIVIKPLSDYFEGLSGFAGAAEVGSNEVVLVLDAEALLSEAFEKKKALQKG
ncbi:MAG: chemotaxis protein CheA [Thermodesulfovibrionales bacterium]|nr:chemotaxis protein CheA [Thermodesulfovibrionales bacterium]